MWDADLPPGSVGGVWNTHSGPIMEMTNIVSDTGYRMVYDDLFGLERLVRNIHANAPVTVTFLTDISGSYSLGELAGAGSMEFDLVKVPTEKDLLNDLGGLDGELFRSGKWQRVGDVSSYGLQSIVAHEALLCFS